MIEYSLRMCLYVAWLKEDSVMLKLVAVSDFTVKIKRLKARDFVVLSFEEHKLMLVCNFGTL